MENILWFIGGLFIGSIMGIFIMVLLIASNRFEDGVNKNE